MQMKHSSIIIAGAEAAVLTSCVSFCSKLEKMSHLQVTVFFFFEGSPSERSSLLPNQMKLFDRKQLQTSMQ